MSEILISKTKTIVTFINVKKSTSDLL